MALQTSSAWMEPALESCSKPPTFLTLPAEIRLKIYEYVFTKIKIFNIADPDARGLTYKVTPKHAVALLAVSRKIRIESEILARAGPVHISLADRAEDRCPFDAATQLRAQEGLPDHVLRRISSVRVKEPAPALLRYFLCFNATTYTSLNKIRLRNGFEDSPLLCIRLPFDYGMSIGLHGKAHKAVPAMLEKGLQTAMRDVADEVKDNLRMRGLTVRLDCSIIVHSKEDLNFYKTNPIPSRRIYYRVAARTVLDWSKRGVRIVRVESGFLDKPKEKPSTDTEVQGSESANGNSLKRKHDGDDEAQGSKKPHVQG